MPKRKRDGFSGTGDRVEDIRRTGVEEKLVHSKKLLHRALKTSKGLYRQKLGKKVTQAKAKAELDELPRLEREITALKGLDLDKSTDVLLYKTLLKSDAIAESELLPEYVKAPLPKPEGSEEELNALHNVVSGVYNGKMVREVLNQAMNGIYIAMGIPAPAANSKGKKANKKEPAKGILKESGPRQPAGRDREAIEDEAEPAWEGFDSDAEDQNGHEGQEDGEDDSELDEEELSRYDALLGASSDEESLDLNLPRSRLSLRDLSITPSPSRSPSPERRAKKSKGSTTSARDAPQKVGGSTFLPTLMGGYWSGSESSASDLEDDEVMKAPPAKKNRKGQMERRLIAQKKFGANANHVKKGLGLKGQTAPQEDDGWDAKRGAKDGSEPGARGRGRGSSRGGAMTGGRSSGGRQRNFEQVTGENAIAVQPRKRGLGKKDDAGPLHESWMAAKKAKEAQKAASFQGKKITFD
ncbi:NADH-ubiquinone oxidoreductase 30.4 kDa subunit [Phlyctema vagabunda]|uniref:NADH-ubiquinone oxidoreductase 30.4 kDa subunit n=1 Tax=Phlyctema vagabunda TaxID=108571 RepID=A0ABR4PEM4_9HELO